MNMVTLEMVERLREKAGVSFELAKEALEASGGDLLDAMIYLERQGHIPPPPNGGFSSGAQEEPHEPPRAEHRAPQDHGRAFRETLSGIGRFCLRLLQIGNSNSLEVLRGGEVVISCPVTVFAVLLLVAFWFVVPLMVVGLFLGCRYRFVGRELGSESVNKVMDDVAESAEDIKNSFKSKE